MHGQAASMQIGKLLLQPARTEMQRPAKGPTGWQAGVHELTGWKAIMPVMSSSMRTMPARTHRVDALPPKNTSNIRSARLSLSLFPFSPQQAFNSTELSIVIRTLAFFVRAKTKELCSSFYSTSNSNYYLSLVDSCDSSYLLARAFVLPVYLRLSKLLSIHFSSFKAGSYIRLPPTLHQTDNASLQRL